MVSGGRRPQSKRETSGTSNALAPPRDPLSTIYKSYGCFLPNLAEFADTYHPKGQGFDAKASEESQRTRTFLGQQPLLTTISGNR